MKKKTNDKNPSLALNQIFDSISNEIVLSAILNRVYAEKLSFEIVTAKVNHQINSMESSIEQINHNFIKKSKNYDKVKEEIIKTMEKYENLLRQFCATYDEKIEETIMKKVEVEAKLWMALMQKEYWQNQEFYETDENGILKSLNHVVDKIKNKVAKKEIKNKQVREETKNGDDKKENFKTEEYQKNQKCIINLEKELKNLSQEIQKLNEEKKNKVFEAMEVGDKQLSVQIRKPRKITKITKFFANRLNPYKVIIKTVIEPMNQRIDEFKQNYVEQLNQPKKELEISQIEQKIIAIKDDVVLSADYKMICKKLGVLQEI